MRDSSIVRVFRTSFPALEQTGFRTAAWARGLPETPEELRPYHPTIPHALATAAKLETENRITVLPERADSPEVQLSYAELYVAATQVAAGLLRFGVQPGERVLLVFPTSHEFLTTFLGTQLVNAIPVPACPPVGLRLRMGLERLSHIGRRAAASVCVTTGVLRPILGELAFHVPSLRHVVTADALGKDIAPREEFYVRTEDPAFIQFTSGSTGNPRGVLLTHQNLVANIHAIGQAVRLRHHDIVVSWLPLYHDMGLIGAFLFAVYWRLPLVLMHPTAFLRHPARWLQAIHRFRGTISTAPNFGYALCVRRVTPEQREGLDLSCWRLALNGSEPVSRKTIVDFVSTYEPHGFRRTAMLPVYGLAEAVLAVAFPEPGLEPRYDEVDRDELSRGRAVPGTGPLATYLASVGTAVPGHLIMLVQEDGQPVPDRTVGHIVVAGKSLMQGYYRDPAATKVMLRGGWLWTGDMGYLADGQLYVTGRAKDVIILRGRNIHAEDVERCVEPIEGARPGSVVAFGVHDEAEGTEVVVLVCETRVTEPEARATLVERVKTAVTEACDVLVREVVLVPPGTIPKTSSGKRQRSLCRERYLRGTLTLVRTGPLAKVLLLLRSALGYLLMRSKRLVGRRRGEPWRNNWPA